MFRAQHVYPTAPGEQEYRYSFTPYNVPSFVGTLLAGARKENIPLPLDADAPFILRAMQAHESPYGLAMRFRDPWRNYLSDDANPTLEDLFQSTPPARAATREDIRHAVVPVVSIHAARAGGDRDRAAHRLADVAFQSTPPARAATTVPSRHRQHPIVSIHAARAGGDAIPAQLP